jgi:hypothetical protein
MAPSKPMQSGKLWNTITVETCGVMLLTLLQLWLSVTMAAQLLLSLSVLHPLTPRVLYQVDSCFA